MDDRYSRVDYRRLIAWKTRIEREGRVLEELLAAAPERSVVDLGCGTGEHCAFFADLGARVVGLDDSPSMVEKARSHECEGGPRFLLRDARERPGADELAPFGLALCLGNMLPHLQEDEDLEALLNSTHERLLPGGIFFAQLLNYHPVLEGSVLALPLNIREDDDGESIVFLRLMKATDDERVLFFPTTLALDPDSEEPVSIRSTRRVPLRAWTRERLLVALKAAGFEAEFHGNIRGDAFDPKFSKDLVIRARRI